MGGGLLLFVSVCDQRYCRTVAFPVFSAEYFQRNRVGKFKIVKNGVKVFLCNAAYLVAVDFDCQCALALVVKLIERHFAIFIRRLTICDSAKNFLPRGSVLVVK